MSILRRYTLSEMRIKNKQSLRSTHKLDKNMKLNMKIELGHEIQLLVPDTILVGKRPPCIVVFNTNLPENVDYYAKFICDEKSTFAKAIRINNTTLTFFPPENFPPGEAYISFHFGDGQHTLCSYKSSILFESPLDHVHALLEQAAKPLSFFSSACGLHETISMDAMLERYLRMNMPKDYSLLQKTFIEHDNINFPINSSLLFPTLLHFAAHHGLEKVTEAVLVCPGAVEALTLQNCDGNTPLELANRAEHTKIVEMLISKKKRAYPTTPEATQGDELYEAMGVFELHEINEEEGCEYEEMTSCRNSAVSRKELNGIHKNDVTSSNPEGVTSGRTGTPPPPPLPPADYNSAEENTDIYDIPKAPVSRKQRNCSYSYVDIDLKLPIDSSRLRSESTEIRPPEINSRPPVLPPARGSNESMQNYDIPRTQPPALPPPRVQKASPPPSLPTSRNNSMSLNDLADVNSELYDTVPARMPQQARSNSFKQRTQPPTLPPSRKSLTDLRSNSLDKQFIQTRRKSVSQENIPSTEIYDIVRSVQPVSLPSSRSSSFKGRPVKVALDENDNMELYDTIPSREPVENNVSEVYDVVPSPKRQLNDLSEIYDLVPSRPSIEENEHELYDSPTSKANLNTTEETLEMNGGKETPEFDMYIPPRAPVNDVYDLVPPRNTRRHSNEESIYKAPKPIVHQKPKLIEAEIYDDPKVIIDHEKENGAIRNLRKISAHNKDDLVPKRPSSDKNFVRPNGVASENVEAKLPHLPPPMPPPRAANIANELSVPSIVRPPKPPRKKVN